MERRITLVTDSACDLPVWITDAYGIKILTISVNTGQKGEKALDATGFYRNLRTGLAAFTSAVKRECFFEHVEPLLAEGKDVLYIGLSSVLSETFENARSVFAELERRYPARALACIDSKSASMGQGLLVYLAAKQLAAGLSLGELSDYVREMIPKISHWFTVDNLSFLKRGGRISATLAVGGSALHMMPLLHVDDAGHLVNVEKVRGRAGAVRAMFERLKSTAIDIRNQTVMISHGDCIKDALYLADMIREECSPEDIIVGTINPVIGAHAGPGTLALFFIGTQR